MGFLIKCSMTAGVGQIENKLPVIGSLFSKIQKDGTLRNYSSFTRLYE
jgi:hypothetical protein